MTEWGSGLHSALSLTKCLHIRYQTDPGDSFVKVGRIDISTAVFEKTKAKLSDTVTHPAQVRC